VAVNKNKKNGNSMFVGVWKDVRGCNVRECGSMCE